MTKKLKTPILETERLTLKPLGPEHLDDLQKHFNNWNIIKNLNGNVPWPYPKDGTKTFYKTDLKPRLDQGHDHAWVITEKSESEALGLIEFRSTPPKDKTHRGFWIAEDHWGKGYITEAVTAVNDFIFFDLEFPKMRLDNFLGNVGSRRIKEKTGSTFIGTIKKPWRDGKEIEVEMWELTKDAWAKFRTPNAP
ncbi:MAG: GNAT family N-acetyltransferase [Alphaproteobacteria bacterium]|nr:GNAT family N-acetyltransferase [Alphaproteobacteria bacterium]